MLPWTLWSFLRSIVVEQVPQADCDHWRLPLIGPLYGSIFKGRGKRPFPGSQEITDLENQTQGAAEILAPCQIQRVIALPRTLGGHRWAGIPTGDLDLGRTTEPKVTAKPDIPLETFPIRCAVKTKLREVQNGIQRPKRQRLPVHIDF